jgi:hypothetical protein
VSDATLIDVTAPDVKEPSVQRRVASPERARVRRASAQREHLEATMLAETVPAATDLQANAPTVTVRRVVLEAKAPVVILDQIVRRERHAVIAGPERAVPNVRKGLSNRRLRRPTATLSSRPCRLSNSPSPNSFFAAACPPCAQP